MTSESRSAETVAACSMCGRPTAIDLLDEARSWRFRERPDGACPACVQEALLQTLLENGDAALHAAVQTCWPLDAEAAFGALPTPLRMHSDPRYLGRGRTIALIDSGFHPHPDLVKPANRIHAWVDAGRDEVVAIRFAADDQPRWPGWDAGEGHQWHGTMTSVSAAGNGFLGHGLYRGLASEAGVVLIAARQPDGRITNASIERALRWLVDNGEALGVTVASLSVAGDEVAGAARTGIDRHIDCLVARGVAVVCAAGNDGVRRLVPPATCPAALTVGGIDDANNLDHRDLAIWHSNYGEAADGGSKPELVAPSLWLAAPVLPGTAVAREAAALFAIRRSGDRSVDRRIDELKLISPHYQHVDGTSFAAPIVASIAACMQEANPSISARLVRELLIRSAHPVPGAPRERQGAGAVEAGRAVALAAGEAHATTSVSPTADAEGTRFFLHDHRARRVRVCGSWNGWNATLEAGNDGAGFWVAGPVRLSAGTHAYKYIIDDDTWIDDPLNAQKTPDGLGGLNSVVTTKGGRASPDRDAEAVLAGSGAANRR